jgi:hypothetical protein
VSLLSAWAGAAEPPGRAAAVSAPPPPSVVSSAAAPSAAAAPAPPAKPLPPPPRWWDTVGGNLADRLNARLSAGHVDDDTAARAAELLTRFQHRAADHVAAHRPEIARLAERFEELVARPGAGDSEGWEEYHARSRRLYAPVAALIKEFDSELAALPVAVPAPEMPASVTLKPEPAEPAESPAKAEPGGPWATREQVNRLLAELPRPPTRADLESALAARLAAGGPDPTAADRWRASMEDRVRRIEEHRTARGQDYGRIAEVIDILRRRPSSMRTADLPLLKAAWLDLVAPAVAEAEAFRSEIGAAPAAVKDAADRPR